MVIFLLMLLACGTAALVAASVWPAVRRGVTAAAHPAAVPRPRPPATPESIEGVLVGQLAAGAIDRRQYLRAMEFVARRDAGRHPMRVPSED